MTTARNEIINVIDTPYYHVMGRCVRRDFLCGEDKLTGRDYSHRKQWIVDKVAELSNVYLIEVCAYAVMSNHYHLVLKINHDRGKLLSDKEVIERWTALFNGNVLVARYLRGECKTKAELDKVAEVIAVWRERLCEVSWFMRCLNETIARMANAEDKCTGRFWEGRFKSQALLNEQALLSCMAYVDLNPIRAGLAGSLDESEFTGIEQRIKEISGALASVNKDGVESTRANTGEPKPIKLASFVGSKDVDGIACLLVDYMELVDWTGRVIRDGKRGYIDKKEPKILNKLGFTRDIWFKSLRQFKEHSHSHIGSEKELKAVCDETGKKWLAGTKLCRELYVS